MINKANNESVRTSLVSDNVKYLKESEFKSNDRLTKKVNKIDFNTQPLESTSKAIDFYLQNESKLYNDNPKDFNRISHRFDEKSYLKDRKLNENISNISKSCHEHNDINIGATPKNFNINLNPKLDKSIINSPDKENSPVKLFHKRSTVKNYGENSQEGHQKMGNDSSEIKNIKIISCKPASKDRYKSSRYKQGNVYSNLENIEITELKDVTQPLNDNYVTFNKKRI